MKKHSRLHVQRLKLKPFDYFMLLGTAVSLVFLLFTFATYTDSAKTRQTELVQTALENMAVNQKKQFDNFSFIGDSWRGSYIFYKWTRTQTTP